MQARAGYTLKTVLVGVMLGLPLVLVSASGAAGSDLRMTIEKPHFTCEGQGAVLSHTAYIPGARRAEAPTEAAPLPCCDGQIGCAQFLSTNTILRSRHQMRT